MSSDRLSLTKPTYADVDGIFAVCSDPDVWRHYPSLRHTERSESAALVNRWIAGWKADGLGTWIVREAGCTEILGYGGCSVLHSAAWNLGYRLAVSAQGNGYATELSHTAVEHARSHRPLLPVVAYLVEHNRSSARVAEKLGLELVHRAPDAGNPDSDAIRLVYSDRPLTDEQLSAVLR